jgi:hypothetical protein
MKYIPYYELNDTPNIIVDGGANPATRLTLSHWPHSGTPWPLKQDLSAQIVFQYLKQSDFHIHVDAVSNNHFDEDGLISVFTILNTDRAQAMSELLIDIAAAGDFGTYHLRDAARIAFVISAFGSRDTSPLPSEIFDRSYPEATAVLYHEMLERLPAILDRPDNYREYWEKEEEFLMRSEENIRSGHVRLERVPELDLAVVVMPEGERCHPWALHNATPCFRILTMAGTGYEFKYRYETWVQYVSSPVIPRVDLAPMAERFSEQDGSPWIFDGVDAIVPALYPEASGHSKIAPESVRRQIEEFLATAPPAWDPFDPRNREN